jgi:hypothetical protein
MYGASIIIFFSSIVNLQSFYGASVAKWLAHLLSSLRLQVQASVRTFSMRLELSPHAKTVKVNALPKDVGFLRVLQFPPTGKVDRVGEAKGPTVISLCCCGDPSLVGKAKQLINK